MKFLVDHQLPPALATFLKREGHSAQHVRELGLKESDDTVVWRHAVTHQMTVVSKDEDFYFHAVAPGSTGKLVWVRLGNCRNRPLLEKFSAHLKQIVLSLESGNRVMEIR